MRATQTLLAAGLLACLQARAAASAPSADEVLRQRREQDLLIGVYVRTRACMRTAGVAALTQGEDRPPRVVYFMASVCGSPMVYVLRRGGMGEYEARDTVARLAWTSYYEDVLRVPEPPRNPKNPE